MSTKDTGPADRYDAGRREPRTPSGRAVPVPTGVIVAAVVIPVVLLAVALVLVRNLGEDAAQQAADEPVAAVPIPSPDAESEACVTALEALPETLGEAHRVAFTEPAPPGAAAYRMPDAEPVVVRCGLPAPPTFVVGVPLQAVNGVEWFNEPDPDPAVTASTWVAVDRPVYVAVTLPEGSGTGPIQDLSDALAGALDAVEPDPAPIG